MTSKLADGIFALQVAKRIGEISSSLEGAKLRRQESRAVLFGGEK